MRLFCENPGITPHHFISSQYLTSSPHSINNKEESEETRVKESAAESESIQVQSFYH